MVLITREENGVLSPSILGCVHHYFVTNNLDFIKLSPSILGCVHNSIYYCFSLHSITFPQKVKHFAKKSGAAVFHATSNNPVFMRIYGFSPVFPLHFFRLPHFFMHTSINYTFLHLLQHEQRSASHF